jgi:selenocysteine lyase/cysteine desulfurase
MTSRKKFLQFGATSLAGLLLPNIISATNKEILEEPSTDFTIDKQLIYLNNGTAGPSPKVVTAAVLAGLEDINTNGLYGRRRAEAIDNLSSFIGCNRDEIVLTQNTTEGINMMVWGVPLKAGDEVLISQQEHIGNAGAWLHRAAIDKIVVKTVAVGATAEQSLALVKKAITTKTKVIALPHITCTNGQILPIKQIATLAKAKNIFTCIDGAQTTGIMPIDVKDLGVDCYASCCHKWLLAAQGTGYLYISSNKIKLMRTTFFGAEGTVSFNTTQPIATLIEKNDVAAKMGFGTHSGALAASITAAVQYQNALGKNDIWNHGKMLCNYLADGLQQFKKQITITTPSEKISRGAMLGFECTTKDSKKLYDYLNSKKMVTRFVAENDRNTMRISMHIYNTKSQIDMVLKEIENFVG